MKGTLDVYLDRSLIGFLYQTEQGFMEFSYDESWLENAEAIPLSRSLPLRKEIFKQKECRGVFFDKGSIFVKPQCNVFLGWPISNWPRYFNKILTIP